MDMPILTACGYPTSRHHQGTSVLTISQLIPSSLAGLVTSGDSKKKKGVNRTDIYMYKTRRNELT